MITRRTMLAAVPAAPLASIAAGTSARAEWARFIAQAAAWAPAGASDDVRAAAFRAELAGYRPADVSAVSVSPHRHARIQLYFGDWRSGQTATIVTSESTLRWSKEGLIAI